MHETKRTLIFVATAALSIALAATTHWAMQPAGLEEFSDVGEPFYPEFTDPNAATGLRVAAYNKDAARVDVFNVEFKDGQWRIPSHHNYPADGEKRLAETATSIIGIEREALASTSADDFKRLGVLDPLDEKVTGTEGRGDRITLFAGDSVLADYIIGKKVEGQTNVYHVRKPDENRTYRAALNIDISTKFADWIEPGLLDVTRSDLREIVIDRYSVDEVRGAVVQGDVSRLTRESSTADWKLDGIAENEKLKTSEVNSVINALEDLKIVGVRAKPEGLIAALKGERDGLVDPRGLAEKGFFLTEQGFVSNEGEVHVAAADGVQYVLQFGEVFTGSDVEIEIGKDATGEDAAADASPDADASGDKPDDADDGASETKSNKQSRYLFIRTGFDESLIKPPGEKPTPPEKPEGADENADAAPEADADAKPDENAAEVEPAAEAEKPEAEEGDADGKDAAADESTAEQEYQKVQLADYESKLKIWESEQKAYEEKLTKGRERVKELNARFADWYYVISAETFDEIRVERSALVESKEPEDNPDDSGAAAPGEPPAAPDVPQPETNANEDAGGDASEPPAIDESTLPPGDPKFAPPPADSPPDDGAE